MIKKFSILAGILILLASCSHKVTTSISKSYEPLDYREDVRVFGLNDPVPSHAEQIGEVKIDDTGFSTNCGYEVAIEKAKYEARKIGGNAIKITQHTPPSAMGSSCHRITASILKVNDFSEVPLQTPVDSSLLNVDYALLHIYRMSAAGFLVSYDLHLGDSVICRVQNNWKTTLRIRKDGYNSLWARTETKEEIPIKIEMGKEYYVRCGITLGAFVGHPKLELVDNSTGKVEYQAIKNKNAENRDIVTLNSGREIVCTIHKEDDSKLYITLNKDGKEVETYIDKSLVSHIERAETE